MAKNLRAKLPKSDKLVIHDINTTATEQFAEEHTGQNVEVVKSVRKISEQAVSSFSYRTAMIENIP